MKRIVLFLLLALSVVPLAFADTALTDDGWIKVKSIDGITIYRKKIEGSSIVAFRGETVIDAPIAKVAQVLSDTSRKREWVDRCLEAQNIRVFSPLERIEYNKTDSPWPVADRDFLFRVKTEFDKEQKQLIIRFESVEDPAKPDVPDTVRGRLYDSRYVLTSLDDGMRTRILVQIQADPKGEVPKWIVNLVQRDWPRQTLLGIERQVAKPDVPEHPLVRAAFER
jgi:START domain-containing protein